MTPIAHELLWCRFCGAGWGSIGSIIPAACPHCERLDWIRTGDDAEDVPRPDQEPA